MVCQFRTSTFLMSNICFFPVQRKTSCCVKNSSLDGANLYCHGYNSCCLLKHGAPFVAKEALK